MFVWPKITNRTNIVNNTPFGWIAETRVYSLIGLLTFPSISICELYTANLEW